MRWRSAESETEVRPKFLRSRDTIIDGAIPELASSTPETNRSRVSDFIRPSGVIPIDNTAIASTCAGSASCRMRGAARTLTSGV